MTHLHFNTNYFEALIRNAQSQVPTKEKARDPLAEIIQMALGTACTIYVWHGPNQWTGSGFHIGDGVIVTAGHVVPPELEQNSEARVAVSFDKKELLPSQVLISDPDTDCALLMCKQIANSVPRVLLGNSDEAMVGDQITVISSPEGWHGTATTGRITNIHQALGSNAPSQAWNDIMFIDADILQGSSGGMCLGTDGLVYGSIVGVTGQHADIGIGESSVCPSNKIMEIVEQYKHNR